MPCRAPLPVVAAVALALSLATARPANAQSLVERASGAAFSVHRGFLGRAHTAVGVGLRRAYVVFKVYAVGFYVADEDGGKAFRKLVADTPGGLPALRANGRLHAWLTSGEWGRAIDFVMLRDIEKGRMAGTIRYRLAQELGDLEASDVKPVASRFFAAIDVPLRKGQRFTVVQRPGHEIAALLDGKLLVTVRNKRVAAGIWRVYFGPRAIDQDLKRTLVAHLENLVR